MSAPAPVPLPSSLTLPQASQALGHIRQAVREQGMPGGEVVIDGSPLQQLDSSAISVLLQCRREAQARGQRLVLQAAPPKLLALMRLYGVAELFAEPAPVSGR